MTDFISYKGFKIQQTSHGFVLWAKSLFNPVDLAWDNGKTLSDVKKKANRWLRITKQKSWPELYPDRICAM